VVQLWSEYFHKFNDNWGGYLKNTNMVIALFNSLQRQDISLTLMTSIGFGARLYTALSSETQVIHLDVIKPLSSDLNVNNVEFRITTKHSF
jgi:hypothetical protein